MGATKQATGMPATVIDLLEQEWQAMRATPAVVQALARWGRDDEVLPSDLIGVRRGPTLQAGLTARRG